MSRKVLRFFGNLMVNIGYGALEDMPQVVGVPLREMVVEKIERHFQSSKTVAYALQKAFQEAIKTLEVALSAPHFYDKLTTKKVSREFAGEFAQIVRELFREQPPLGLSQEQFTRKCLADLRHLQKNESFLAEKYSARELAIATGDFIVSEAGQLVNKQREADLEFAEAIAAISTAPQALAALLRYRNVLLEAGRLHFGLALQNSPELFRAYWMTNQQGVKNRLETILAEMQEAKEERNRDRFRDLQQQKQMFEQIAEELEFGLDKVKSEIVAVLDEQFRSSHRHFGVIGEHLDELSAASATIISELADLGMQLGELQRGVSQVEAAVHLEAGQNRALLEQQGEQMAQMKKMLQQLLEQGNFAARPSLSDSLLVQPHQRNAFVEAQNYYQTLPPEQQNHPELLLKMGRLSSMLTSTSQQTSSADKYLVRAVQYSRNNREKALACYNLYVHFLQNGDYDKAFGAYCQAISNDDDLALFDPAQYKPLKILGAGGFGVVFLCHSMLMDEKIVVKALDQSRLHADASVEMLRAEAQSLRKINSPYIIGFEDCGYRNFKERQGPYVAMSYFNGEDLDTWIKKNGPFPLKRGLAIAHVICEGLLAAHNAGVIHRDLKPANILYREDGSDFALKIIDFGLALRGESLQQATNSLQSTQQRSIIGQSIAGTLAYAPPEQKAQSIDGKLWPVGKYSDIYTYGNTLCMIFFGTLRLRGKDVRNFASQELLDLIDICLEESPPRRPPDFATILRGLREIEKPSVAPTVIAPTPVTPVAPAPAPSPKPQTTKDEWSEYVKAGKNIWSGVQQKIKTTIDNKPPQSAHKALDKIQRASLAPEQELEIIGDDELEILDDPLPVFNEPTPAFREPSSTFDVIAVHSTKSVFLHYSSKLYFAPNIPRDKLDKAKSSYSIEPDEHILLLIDCSNLWGKKFLIIVTTTTIYWTDKDIPIALDLVDIDQVVVGVALGNRVDFTTPFEKRLMALPMDFPLTDFVEVLKALVTFIQRK